MKGNKASRGSILKKVIIIAVIAAVFVIPFRKSTFLDGGSNVFEPFIPWYGLIRYHEITAAPYTHHNADGNPADEIPDAEYPSYYEGNGLIFFWSVEVVLNKNLVYRDGHKEKAEGFAIYVGDNLLIG